MDLEDLEDQIPSTAVVQLSYRESKFGQLCDRLVRRISPAFTDALVRSPELLASRKGTAVRIFANYTRRKGNVLFKYA
jgi:hypothetical protein